MFALDLLEKDELLLSLSPDLSGTSLMSPGKSERLHGLRMVYRGTDYITSTLS